jgi:hypothetical protein
MMFQKPVQNARSGLRARPQADEKAQHTFVCEHFKKTWNAAIEPQMAL